MNEWSGDIEYINTNSLFIPEDGGVYIVLRNDNVPGQYTNVYIGKAENLHDRYIQHFANTEQNQCLRGNLQGSECYFRYLILNTEQDRSDKEGELLKSYSWQCNQKMEGGERV